MGWFMGWYFWGRLRGLGGVVLVLFWCCFGVVLVLFYTHRIFSVYSYYI